MTVADMFAHEDQVAAFRAKGLSLEDARQATDVLFAAQASEAHKAFVARLAAQRRVGVTAVVMH